MQARKWITVTKVDTKVDFVYCYDTMKELEGGGGGVT